MPVSNSSSWEEETEYLNLSQLVYIANSGLAMANNSKASLSQSGNQSTTV